jgi:hydrogenase/urease accessory protein HupE
MRRFWPAPVVIAACVALALPAGDAAADIAFPARLDVTEREPGVYEVFFSLPIVEGRKLKAEPRLPVTCQELTERVDGISSSGYSSTWTVQCAPASLAGEAIFVDGLLGTQTDLAFTLKLHDGRTYARILRPSRPGFLVPDPPSPLALGGEATMAGLRRTLRYGSLWLLIATAALLGARPRELLAGAAAFAVGHGAAQWLGGRGWLEVVPLARDAFVWATVAVAAIRLAGAGAGWLAWLRPFGGALLLVGLLFGGARPEALPADGLSDSEQLLALVLFAGGAAAAMLLMAAAGDQLRALLGSRADGGRSTAPLRWFGYLAGGLAVGLWLAQLIGLAVAAEPGSRPVLELLVLAAVLAPTVAQASRRAGTWGLGVALGGAAAAGTALGLSGVALPLASLATLGTLLVLGFALATDRPLSSRWAVVVGAAALLMHSWATASWLAANVSRSTALTGGALLAALCVFYAGYAVACQRLPAERAAAGAAGPSARTGTDLPLGWRVLGATVAICAAGWRLAEYGQWFGQEVATDAALGLLRLPLLSLALLLLALLLWPRRRRVARALGVEPRTGQLHWWALGAAFLLLPYGNLAVRGPLAAPAALSGDDARRVMTALLSDTYHAFNLADEDELYDRLAANVTGDLVDDLYLDSRRRLTAGTREGTEVTVRDVVVLELGEPLAGADAAAGVAYDCRWAVIARVRHLQHIHHRKNIYNGVLMLRPDGDRWKIGAVELHSEDREVVPWQKT